VKDIRRKLYSQNFIHSSKLIEQLVRKSTICNDDLVVEIGPGKGIITRELLRQAQHVIAVEIDYNWYSYMNERFPDKSKLTLFNQDFLSWNIPRLPYKVFANVPFAIEGKIVRKLIEADNPPSDAYLVVMKELGYRLAAPYKENMFSIMHKPFFTLEIVHHFHPTDFRPVPSVDAVLFRFTQKAKPLVPLAEKKEYQRFVQTAFGQGDTLWRNLNKSYGREKTAQVCRELDINKQTKPGHLNLEKWIELYNSLG
jgi:23S rRNA (adenine-N6)-dimethyltransferase